MAAAFFYLVGDNRTATLALTPPTWGRPLTGLPASGGFQMSDWHDLPHVVLYRLARHQARVREPSRATCCVVASPMGSRHPTADERSECRPGIAERLASLGEHHCPGRPLVIIGGPDADGSGTALCNGLWGPHRSCARGLADPIVRVTGNVPGLQSEVAGRGARGLCRRLVTPYLSHARTPLAAANTGSVRRSLRIAYAAASWGHVDADAHGFVAWRKALRNACKALDTTQCQWVWISMSGNGAEKAIQRYSDADFCLQPPGDTLPRPGIMDAISVGCVPVLFHPGQQMLWPDHWPTYNESSVTFDWTGGAPRPRLRDQKRYAERARADLKALVEMPEAELRRLQKGVALAAPRLIYRLPRTAPSGSGAAAGTAAGAAAAEAATAAPGVDAIAAELPAAGAPPDAVDVLVERMRGLRLVAEGEEAEAHARYLERRRAMVEAQTRYEARNVPLRLQEARKRPIKGRPQRRPRRKAAEP